jgi:hypothetical protein
MSTYRRKGGHGGKRAGSGRPKGSISKRRPETVERLKAAGQELPLDRLLRRMADETESERYRDSLAIATAPFLHLRLSAVSAPRATFEMSSEELEALLYRELEYARRQGDLKLVRQLEEALRGDRPPPRLAVNNSETNGSA